MDDEEKKQFRRQRIYRSDFNRKYIFKKNNEQQLNYVLKFVIREK